MHGLDTIDWTSLQGPYGPSTDVPTRLRALQFHQRDDDVWELIHAIWHQGTVYPVTPVALKFVYQLAENKPTCPLLTAPSWRQRALSRHMERNTERVVYRVEPSWRSRIGTRSGTEHGIERSRTGGA